MRKPTVQIKKGKIVNCNFCNKEFYLRPSHIPPRSNSVNKEKYCSRKCYALHLRTNKERVCKECGKKYYVSKSQVFYRNIQCCSNECRYKQYKKKYHKNWQEHKKLEKNEGLLPRHIMTRHLPKGNARTIKSLIKKLDKIFSIFIRKKDCDSNGFVQCYTCISRKHYTEMDAGHYVSRRYLSVRFDERNTKPQCRKCNRFLNGNPTVYTLKLIGEYGVPILDELNRKRQRIKQFSVKELTSEIEKYKSIIKS